MLLICFQLTQLAAKCSFSCFFWSTTKFLAFCCPLPTFWGVAAIKLKTSHFFFFLSIILFFSIWYVFYSLLWVKCEISNITLFLFTFSPASQHFGIGVSLLLLLATIDYWKVCVCVCCDGSLEFSIMQMTKNCVKYIALNLNSAIV